MPIFRAHTCSTLTVPSAGRSRSSSKGSARGVLGSSPRTLPASRFSSETRCSRAEHLLESLGSSDSLAVPRSPRPSSSASRSSLRSNLSSQNLSSPSSSPLSSHSPFAPPSPSSPHPRSQLRQERVKGSKERVLRSSESKEWKDWKDWMEQDDTKEGKESKEVKERESNGRGSIQLPHLKPREPKESKENEIQSQGLIQNRSVGGERSVRMLPRPKTVETLHWEERGERERDGLTPQEQLLNLFSGARHRPERQERQERPRPELLVASLVEPGEEMPQLKPPPEPISPTHPLVRPSSKYKTWHGKMSYGSYSRRTLATPTAQTSTKKIQRLEEGQKIFDLYYWEEILQEEGDGGKVVVCRPKNTEEDMDLRPDSRADKSSFRFVMKIKSKEALRQDMHEEQFAKAQTRLLNLSAPAGVIQIQQVLEDENFYYVVMDRASGGSFFNSLLEEYRDGTMPPSAVCKVARDILETLRHLHKEGILHRDIKPDNMVMHSHTNDSGQRLQKVTLIDFDHADADFSGMGLTQVQHCFGTARFNAPEAFLGFYSAATDLYSVGVIVYLLLTGSMPYPSELFDFPASPGSPASPTANRRWMRQVVAQMEAHQIDWNHPTFHEIPLSKDFCQHLLAFNMVDRAATAEDALRHPWISSESLE